jgi:hypothetical protein
LIHLLLGLLALAASPDLSAAPVSPSAEPAPQASQILSDALSQAKNVRITPFLEYRYTITMAHKAKAKTYRYSVLERMSDHYGRFTGVNPDGTLSQDIHLHATLVSPGMFLDAAAEDTSGADGLKTIGHLVVAPYVASLAGVESVDGCADAYHLLLTPKGDEERHALRELWVDKTTDRICRAKIHKTVNIIARTPVTIDVRLDDKEFITHWSFSGTGHTVAGPYTLDADGDFADIAALPAADPVLFR